MSNKPRELIALSILAFVVILSIYWSNNSQTIKILREEKAIKDFTGEYFVSHIWGWHLSIRTDSTFKLEVFGDTGLERRTEYNGLVVIKNNKFILVTNDENFNEPIEYLPVKWGQRKYHYLCTLRIE